MSDLPAIRKSTSAIREQLTQNQVTPVKGGGKSFLKFDARNSGDWLVGATAELCTGDVFALDVGTIQHGWILWHARKADRKLVPINQPLPVQQEPVHYTDAKGKAQVDEAAEARAFEGVFLDDDGNATDDVFSYETNSYGGLKAVDAVLEPLFQRAQAGSDYIFPTVRLDTDSYEHSLHGEIKNPILTVVNWYNEAGEPEDEAPKRVEKKEEKAEEPAAPAGVRRRKRPAAA